MILNTTKDANVNYTAKAVTLRTVVKHPNADKLQIATVDFQPVIVGLDAAVGKQYVYFPLEAQLSHELISFINGYRDKTLNADKEQAGFFEDNRRIRAVKLRGERSMGFLLPFDTFQAFIHSMGGVHNLFKDGETFDAVGEHVFVKKFVPYQRPLRGQCRNGKSPRVSRLVEGQVRLHVDTENLRRNAHKISPDDYIHISYKTHGTSWWVANVLVNRPITRRAKIAKWFGVTISEVMHDLVYGSRKVVKNEYESQGINNFYDADIWQEIKDEIGPLIPNGYTFYGEALGYLSTGSPIQGKYDYGCTPGTRRLQIYRITFTTIFGFVMELTPAQTKALCDRVGLEYVQELYYGKAKDLYPDLDTANHWQEEFVKRLEKQYTEKDCHMCVNQVPEEGIVVRKDTPMAFEAYKLKSFRFLDLETELLDKGVSDGE